MDQDSTPKLQGEGPKKVDLQEIIETMMQVIKNPAGFFRSMEKTGGLVDPIVFLIVMGVFCGLIQAILTLVGLGGPAASFGMVIFSLLIIPIMILLFGFVVAAILFVIWKLMGSVESYEVAFRCTAYTSGICVITTLLSAIPYIGSIVSLLWMMYLLVTASVEVHRIESRKAWLVFGVLCAFMIMTSISGERQARNIEQKTDEFTKKLEEKMDDMTPEEAGRAVGEFLKGMQEATEQK